MDSIKLVTDTLAKAGKPMKAGEIAEVSGLDKKEVDKVIKKLKTEEKITSPKVCFYELKK
ncbi:MAG: MarR family transcriptional regulator [Bacteroidetes bacterium]|nr:MarR family transcriptional regulator [Bacteroidota bacterium]